VITVGLLLAAFCFLNQETRLPAQKPFTAEDLYELKFVEDAQISPDGAHVAFVKVDVDRVGNKYERHIWLVNLADKAPAPRQFTFGEKADYAPRWSPDGRTLAFVSARAEKPQIYLIRLDGGEARPLTRMPNGAANPVWSPDGRRIAFLSSVNADERACEDSGQTDAPPATALEARHRQELKEDQEKKKLDPRVITRLPYRTGTEYFDDRCSHIYVTDIAPGSQPHRLTDGDLNFNSLSWTRDGGAIISTQSRQPEHDPWFFSAVIRLSATGPRRPYRLLSRPGFEYFSPKVSPDGRWIAALRVGDEGSFGQRARLALLPIGGDPARELTTNFDRAVTEFHWAADSRSLYFLAGDRGDVNLFRVDLRGENVERIVGGRRMLLNASVGGGRIAFVAATPQRPADVHVASANGRGAQRLTDFNDRFLAARRLAPIRERWHTAPDGRRIQGWLLRPPFAPKNRKAPLVVSMHGGPWVMWGPSMPSVWFKWQLLASRGYAVYFCNPRGSEGYGEEHSLIIRNDWGNHVMHDILSGVDAVVEAGGVDSRRMALTGGSYAGYMTAWIISHDQRFVCAWAQRGLYNLASFFGTSDIPQLIEREFETLGFDDIEKLWKQSPLAYVRHIRTPLVIEHQDNDWRCPPSEAEQLYAALKRLRRTVVMVRYPREGHEMSRSGEPLHRVDRLNRMAAWFDQHCQPKKKEAAR
jgi:dipeptidyl aminopeptidase/acylaminoacyl peptidase